jgi:hypothetical protein
MKKLITLSALSFTLCFLFSCTKDSQSLKTSSGINQNGSGSQDGPRMVLPTAPHPDIVGDWISLVLEPVTGPNGNALHGHYDLKIPLSSDYNNDLKLVFIRIAPADWDPSTPLPPPGYLYRPLATDMATSTGKVHIGFYFQPATLDIGIVPYNLSVMPNPDDFKNNQYRYFVVTRSTYLNNPIDWTDYMSVVTVLNTAP